MQQHPNIARRTAQRWISQWLQSGQITSHKEGRSIRYRIVSSTTPSVFPTSIHPLSTQPFADVNKRTSRLAANLPLLRHNLCPLTFLGVPEAAYSQAILGVYEMTRVESLRDLFVWAYERSTQEYLALKQNLAEPDPLRLTYRELIKQVIREVVLTPNTDPLDLIRQAVASIDESEREAVQAH